MFTSIWKNLQNPLIHSVTLNMWFLNLVFTDSSINIYHCGTKEMKFMKWKTWLSFLSYKNEELQMFLPSWDAPRLNRSRICYENVKYYLGSCNPDKATLLVIYICRLPYFFFFFTCKFLRFYYLKQKIVQIWILQSYWDPSENNELLPQTFSLANARFHYFQK